MNRFGDLTIGIEYIDFKGIQIRPFCGPGMEIIERQLNGTRFNGLRKHERSSGIEKTQSEALRVVIRNLYKNGGRAVGIGNAGAYGKIFHIRRPMSLKFYIAENASKAEKVLIFQPRSGSKTGRREPPDGSPSLLKAR